MYPYSILIRSWLLYPNGETCILPWLAMCQQPVNHNYDEFSACHFLMQQGIVKYTCMYSSAQHQDDIQKDEHHLHRLM
jgi:hypothetical protein